jgi:hypothetical protein
MFVGLLLIGLVRIAAAASDEMTEFGTKHAETPFVQTFDARSAAPDAFNM